MKKQFVIKVMAALAAVSTLLSVLSACMVRDVIQDDLDGARKAQEGTAPDSTSSGTSDVTK